jgi:hypothetical protein
MKIESPLLENTATSSYTTLQKAVKAMCNHKSREGNVGLCFSIFKTASDDKGIDSGDWLVNHPVIWSDDPVFEGSCVFFSNYWRIGDNQVNSEIMPNPRWSEIINEAGRQLIDPQDQSTACLFLEGFNEIDSRSDGTRVIEFIWGS